jgi:serine/threonine-protein kinase
VKPLAELAADWPLLDRLLDQALTLDPQDRAAWLEGLDPAYAPLKDTLRRLLDVRLAAETGHFLGTLPKFELPAAGAAHGPAPGDAVGPWRPMPLS